MYVVLLYHHTKRSTHMWYWYIYTFWIFKGDTASLNSEFDNSSLTGSVHSLNAIGQSRSAKVEYFFNCLPFNCCYICIFKSSMNYFCLRFVCVCLQVCIITVFYFNHPSRSFCTATHHLNDAERQMHHLHALVPRIRTDPYVRRQHHRVPFPFLPIDQRDDESLKQQLQRQLLGAFRWPRPDVFCVRVLRVCECVLLSQTIYARVYASAPNITRPSRLVYYCCLLLALDIVF